MGAFAAEHKPDWIIQIGDFFTMDSLISHVKNETLEGKSKPPFLEDIASGEKALAAFDAGLAGYGCTKHITLGNHEDRINSFCQRTPELAGLGGRGMMEMELDRLLVRHGWSYSPYGVPFYLGGVGWIHCCQSIMGKPIGGELSVNTVTLKSTHDWIFGHDHRAAAQRRPKIGVNNSITAIDLGCALPEGHVEPYALTCTTGWWYGIWEIRISKGRIQSYKQHTMSEIAKRYA